MSLTQKLKLSTQLPHQGLRKHYKEEVGILSEPEEQRAFCKIVSPSIVKIYTHEISPT